MRDARLNCRACVQPSRGMEKQRYPTLNERLDKLQELDENMRKMTKEIDMKRKRHDKLIDEDTDSMPAEDLVVTFNTRSEDENDATPFGLTLEAQKDENGAKLIAVSENSEAASKLGYGYHILKCGHHILT